MLTRVVQLLHPPPFLNEVVAKGAFLSKVHPPIYAAVHSYVKQEAPNKQHMHHCCYCISKHMTKEALKNHCMHK